MDPSAPSRLPAPRFLRCEHLVNPLGVDIPRPRFSWIPPPLPGGGSPAACRIILSSTRKRAAGAEGDIWDSGRASCGKACHLDYGGPALRGSTRYYWRVRWWDDRGRTSSFSPTAYFETGVLESEEWKAAWIGPAAGRAFHSPGPTLSGQFLGDTIQAHAAYLRKEFTLEPGWAAARVYVCGLGYYELRLNGRRVGDRALDPAWTDYKIAALYSTFDLAEQLRPGANALAAILGNGRHIENHGYGRPKLYVQLEVDYRDGTRRLIVTGTDWKTSRGPVGENGIFCGQVHDARLEREGWDRPGFDDRQWKAAVRSPPSPLASQLLPAVRVVRELKPRRVERRGKGVCVFDFGQNFAGWTRLAVSGRKGDRIEIRHAELLDRHGGLNTAPNQNAAALDAFVLKGGAEEILEPRFTYHGFRYAEVRSPGRLRPEGISGLVVHSDVRPTGVFRCSHPLVNRLHRNIRWGLLSNLMSIPTDCPQRDERHGWLGDAHLAAEAAVFNFDMAALYRKFLGDIRRAQRPDGSLPDFVPPYFKLTYPADPAWASAYAQLVWLLYYYYGDARVLEEHYPGLKRYLDYLTRAAEGHLQLRLGKYGDWCPPGSIGPKKTPVELTATWYYLHDLLLLRKIAGVLGRGRDERRWARQAEGVEKAFNKRFLGPDGYAGVRFSPADTDAGQTSQVLPLALGIVPDNKIALVLGKLLESLVVHHGHHLDTGILGTRHLLDVLTDHGEIETAFRIVTQTTYPSWGYMIREGATTLWERWENIEGGGMNSHNHIMLGSVDAWFYKILAGARCLSPGWERVEIKPRFVAGLRSASARLDTIRGPLETEWIREANALDLRLRLPAGATAEVHIPRLWPEGSLRETRTVLWRKGRPAKPPPGIRHSASDKEWIRLRVAGGPFRFTFNRTPPRRDRP